MADKLPNNQGRQDDQGGATGRFDNQSSQPAPKCKWVNIDPTVIAWTLSLFILVIIATFWSAADILRTVSKESEEVHIRQELTNGIELQYPGAMGFKSISHDFTKVGTWKNAVSNYTWTPAAGKAWLLVEMIMIVDPGGLANPPYQHFERLLEGNLVIDGKTIPLRELNVYADQIENCDIDAQRFLRLHYKYIVPPILRSSHADYIEVHTKTNSPLKERFCKVAIQVVEKDEKNLGK